MKLCGTLYVTSTNLVLEEQTYNFDCEGVSGDTILLTDLDVESDATLSFSEIMIYQSLKVKGRSMEYSIFTEYQGSRITCKVLLLYRINQAAGIVHPARYQEETLCNISKGATF